MEKFMEPAPAPQKLIFPAIIPSLCYKADFRTLNIPNPRCDLKFRANNVARETGFTVYLRVFAYLDDVSAKHEPAYRAYLLVSTDPGMWERPIAMALPQKPCDPRDLLAKVIADPHAREKSILPRSMGLFTAKLQIGIWENFLKTQEWLSLHDAPLRKMGDKHAQVEFLIARIAKHMVRSSKPVSQTELNPGKIVSYRRKPYPASKRVGVVGSRIALKL